VKSFLVTSLVFFTFGLRAQNSLDIVSPKPTGPWNVGRRLLEWVDSSRLDATDSSRHRTLPVWVWYPTEKNIATDPQHPLPEQWRSEQGKYLDKKIGTGGSQFLQQLKVWAVPDAPAVSVKERFPVLVFGPGYTWLPTDYSTLIEDIVSYGYIVVGYVPTGFPGITQLTNGTIVKGNLTVQQQDIVFQDALFVEKHLNMLTNSWLKDVIDTKQVGIFGHSMGGAAATFVASRDTSIKAFVDLDGDLMGSALKVRAMQPALMLSHDEAIGMMAATQKMDREGRERSEYRRHADWVRATDDAQVALRIRINGILHLNFNDLGLVPVNQMTETERKDKVGMADGAKSIRVISDITRQFFDAYFKNHKFLTLVELENKYPEVQGILWKGIPFYR
jgi:predicted dienelactone hydrolase